MTSDPIEILLAHNRWATRWMLEACDSLTAEQFDQQFEIGHGSARGTVSHILAAMRYWGDILAEREQRPFLGSTQHTLPELLDLLDEISDDIEASVKSHPMADLVSATVGGTIRTFTRAGVLMHVMTHGMHHRAQCLNMLRHLGVDPLPQPDVMAWMVLVDGMPNA